MDETGNKVTVSESLRWLKPLILLLVITVTAMMTYFIYNSLKERPAQKSFTIKSITVLPAQDNGTMALEPFVVVCKGKNPEKSKILIADISLAYNPELKADILARMFDIRSAILDKLQNEGSTLNKDTAEIELEKTLRPYNVQKVNISRYSLK